MFQDSFECGCQTCKDFNNKLVQKIPAFPQKYHDIAWLQSLTLRISTLIHAGSYKKLLKSFLSDSDNFSSYIFEIAFAYQFEKNNYHLNYESKILSENTTSIDFLAEGYSQKPVAFELRLIKQNQSTTQLIDQHLKEESLFHYVFINEDKEELIRIQSALLDKCIDFNNKPIKFNAENYNIIVLNLSELQLNMVDRYDCVQCLYGPSLVPEEIRLSIYGIYQESIPDNVIYSLRKAKFGHFKDMIDGVLFVRNIANKVELIDLEYMFLPNPRFKDFCTKLSFIKCLPPWSSH